jgi:hypothetical protein
LGDSRRGLRPPHDHQENDRKQREGDIAVNGNAGVAGREIAGEDHLLHMAYRVAEKEDRTRHDRRRLEVQAAPDAHAGGRANREIRQAHFELKRTDLPANVRRCDLRKKEMKDRGPEARDANGQEQDPHEQALGARSVGSPHQRKRQRRDEQKHRQVAQDEGDRFGHHGLLARIHGGLDRGEPRVTTSKGARERLGTEVRPLPSPPPTGRR